MHTHKKNIPYTLTVNTYAQHNTEVYVVFINIVLKYIINKLTTWLAPGELHT